MSAIQLGFSLRTSANVKTVHLLGSWDNYAGQLPLSKDAAKAGAWRGTFRFQGSTLQAGQRYWYYYIMDGYHVSHDPAKPFTKEPTTGRSLNILDIPSSATTTSSRGSRLSAEIPKGRSISPSKIVSPMPSKPYASRTIREADYGMDPIDDLAEQLEHASLHGKYSASPASSIGSDSSISSRSGSDSASSLSSLSDGSVSSCRCNRYGITRKGDRVKMDCGGSKCGYTDDDSTSCSSDSDEEIRVQEIRPRATAASASRRR